MKNLNYIIVLLIFSTCEVNAQSTPPDHYEEVVNIYNQPKVMSAVDTIDFTPFSTGTIINNQYLYTGAFFSGHNGSSDPEVYDYTTGIGRVLRSDNWYNAIRLNFVDSLDSTQYNPVQNIEFDNPVTSQVDYISVDVYDSTDVLIYHYLSTSPEHVIINLNAPEAAYITFDDSAGTAYVIDNIYFDQGTVSVELPEGSNEFVQVFPNPVINEFMLSINNNRASTISVSVIDPLGQVVYSFIKNEALSTFKETINLSELSDGFYYVEVMLDGNKVVKKLLKM